MNLEMVPFELIGLKKDLQAIIRALRDLECVQIDELSDSPVVSARSLTLDHETLVHQEETSFLLAQVEGLLTALGVKKTQDTVAEVQIDRKEAADAVKALLPTVQSAAAKLESLQAELASLPRYEATLRKLLPIIPASAREPGKASDGVLVSRAHTGVLDSLGKRILELTQGKAEIVASDVDAATRAMLIVFPEEYAREIEVLLGREDVSRLRLPAGLGEGPPDMVLAALYRRMSKIPEEIKATKLQLSELGSRWGDTLLNIRATLYDDVEINSVFTRFGETDMTFVLVGWVPADQRARVQEALSKAVGQSVFFQPLEMTPELKKRAPVIQDNPVIARPFESLVNLLALPRYGHIDPTRLMAFFLPIFFGMILGDVGYGAILMVICLGLLSRIKRGMMRNIIIVMAISSGWSIVFGFLYGELFGTLGEHLGMHAVWIDRASPDDVSVLLLMTLVVGAAHITLGLILGIFEAAKDRNRNELLERGGMLLGLASLALIIGVQVKVLPAAFNLPGAIGLVIGVLLLGAPLGKLGPFIGAIEMVGLLGNILSYLRIAAIGLASVYLAKVANDVAGMMGNPIASVLVLLMMHGLNLIMGAFSPTIHSLRLHYVEFFRKFYEGGGKPYKPFRSSLASEKN